MTPQEKLEHEIKVLEEAVHLFLLGEECSYEALIREKTKALEAENKRLRGALTKSWEDINWMLNSEKFLNSHVFNYIDEALPGGHRLPISLYTYPPYGYPWPRCSIGQG